MYKIDRKTAAEILKVSVRTVDRYIVAKKLSIEMRNGRIWLDKEEIVGFARLKGVDTQNRVSTSVYSGGNVDNSVSIDVDRKVVMRGNEVVTSIPQTTNREPQNFIQSRSNSSENFQSSKQAQKEPTQETPYTPYIKREEPNEAFKIYKELYEELKAELKIKQDRLEGANYKVGQLEAMLKDTISLPEHKRLLLLEQNQLQQIKSSFDPISIQNESLKARLKDEKFTKKVYLVILFIIMLLQPLWLVLSMK